MVKCFKYIIITLIALIISLALVQHPNNEVYAESSNVEYWAVIIGVADYQYFNSAPLFPKPVKGYDLVYSDNDAIDLAAQLSSIWGESHIKLLIDSQATKSSIQYSITGWLDSKEEANDIVLFYFSGHGQQENNSEYTIWPYDTSKYSDKNEIQGHILDSWLRCLESNQQIIIIDACNSGGFIEELYYYGRVALASCSQDEYSYERPILGHSIFTHFFLDAFNNLDNVDDNNDNSISIQEVFNWVELKTISFAKTQFLSQNPKIRDCNHKQIILTDFENHNCQIPPYITYFITIMASVFPLIAWNRSLPLERVIKKIVK